MRSYKPLQYAVFITQLKFFLSTNKYKKNYIEKYLYINIINYYYFFDK